MKWTLFSSLVVLAIAGTFFYMGRATAPAASQKDTSFQRVIKTNTLRCGYYTYAPLTLRDPVTGKLSGMSVDMMNYFSQKTGIKVEWTEEITFGNWGPSLEAGRYDAVCTPLWPDVAFYRIAKFSRPFLFADLVPIVRSDDMRFANDVSTLNDPMIKIGVMDGDNSQVVAQTRFPKAKEVAIPSSGDYATLLQDLIDKKIDMVLWERNSVYQFDQKNPGKIKALKLEKPLAFMPSELAVSTRDGDLLDMLNGLIEDMENTGTLQALADKWIPKGIALMPAPPFETPKPANQPTETNR